MLTAPAGFVVALELTRMGVQGPSVDAPHLSTFGLIALATGRGIHALLSVVPMVLGAACRKRVWAAAGLILIALPMAIPAHTPRIPGPNGVAELTRVARLGVMIRGVDRAAPVLLFVPGAPGGSETGPVRGHLSGLERHFVVATLDRRGGGSSYPALDPTATVTVDSAVADTLAVTDYLRHRFHQDKIYLLGHSGGSIVSVLAVQRHPEKYRAYIGTGQAVDLPASDRIFYDDVLSWARSTGRDKLARQLVEQGPPPYRSVYAYEPIMQYENEVYGQRPNDFGLAASEYTPLQKAHTLNAILDTWTALYPRMQGIDLRRDAPRLDVPVYFVQGGHEMRGLAVLFDQWYSILEAPRKHLEVLGPGGHRAIFEEPDRFVAIMDRVLQAAP
jgi:pimeloyl-ACP methyl ester carboxylesterase